MYHSSTQRTHWLFREQGGITDKRKAANDAYCSTHKAVAQEKSVQFLLPEEEELIVLYYLKKLLEFCTLFNPPTWAPLPKTALVCMYLVCMYHCVCVCAWCCRQLLWLISNDSTHNVLSWSTIPKTCCTLL